MEAAFRRADGRETSGPKDGRAHRGEARGRFSVVFLDTGVMFRRRLDKPPFLLVRFFCVCKFVMSCMYATCVRAGLHACARNGIMPLLVLLLLTFDALATFGKPFN